MMGRRRRLLMRLVNKVSMLIRRFRPLIVCVLNIVVSVWIRQRCGLASGPLEREAPASSPTC